MMKFLIIILILASSLSQASDWSSVDNADLATITTYATTYFSSSGLIEKKQAEQLQEDLNIYDLTGEVRPELESLAMMFVESSEFKLTLVQAIEEIKKK